MRFRSGLIPSLYDKRDHQASKHIPIFKPIGAVTTFGLPELEPADQIGNSCVSQAIRGRRMQQERLERGKLVSLSAYFLDNSRTPDQYQGTNGAMPREMLSNSQKIGICEEHLFPPVAWRPPGVKASSIAIDNAKYNQIENYFILANSTEIMSAIVMNCGAIMGIPFTAGWQKCRPDPNDPEKLPIVAMPTAEELLKIKMGNILWHMIQIEDVVPGGWKVLNSDGIFWGRRGYAVLPFDFPRLESDTWGFKDKHTPPPDVATEDIILWIGKTTYQVAGKEYTMDVAPEINDQSRTMVPLRFVAQACGYAVGWFDDKRMARISNGIDTVEIIIGANYYLLNGEVRLVSPGEWPVIKDNRTMVPVRFINEIFGRKVEWFKDTQKIVIYK